ncbi:MAG: preprotein translocase subunit SecE [Bradymonadia bacterium]
MNASRRMVNMFFVGSTLLAWGIFTKTFELLFATFNVRNTALLGKEFTLATLAGAGLAVALLFWVWRHRTIRPTLNEVGDELSKVVWPTWDETKTNTMVTVVVTAIIAAILWVFDQVFGWLTDRMLG